MLNDDHFESKVSWKKQSASVIINTQAVCAITWNKGFISDSINRAKVVLCIWQNLKLIF